MVLFLFPLVMKMGTIQIPIHRRQPDTDIRNRLAWNCKTSYSASDPSGTCTAKHVNVAVNWVISRRAIVAVEVN